MDNLWNEIVAAHDEVVDSILGAFNINSTELSENATIFELLEKFLWSNGTSSSSPSSTTDPSFTQTVYGDFAKNLKNFVNAINWQEPFFPILLITHAVILSGTVAAIRRGTDSNFFISWMVSLFGFIYIATFLNEQGAQFAAKYLFPKGGANYFDENGLFISIMWSVPIVLQLIVLLLVMVAHTAKLFAVTKIRKAQMDRANQNNINTTAKKVEEGNKKKK